MSLSVRQKDILTFLCLVLILPGCGIQTVLLPRGAALLALQCLSFALLFRLRPKAGRCPALIAAGLLCGGAGSLLSLFLSLMSGSLAEGAAFFLRLAGWLGAVWLCAGLIEENRGERGGVSTLWGYIAAGLCAVQAVCLPFDGVPTPVLFESAGGFSFPVYSLLGLAGWIGALCSLCGRIVGLILLSDLYKSAK